jgi:hypothetical protein
MVSTFLRLLMPIRYEVSIRSLSLALMHPSVLRLLMLSII